MKTFRLPKSRSAFCFRNDTVSGAVHALSSKRDAADRPQSASSTETGRRGGTAAGGETGELPLDLLRLAIGAFQVAIGIP
jgi:hypothetical protein